ncbi:MAG: metallophosphoesterase family protein [Planctomycetota bacterium]
MVIRVILFVHIIVLALGAANAQGNRPGRTYSFVYLGDIHFDKRSHHDFEWVQANKPNDIRQIEDYVRITEKHTPGLLRRIQTSIESSDGQIKMIIQGGDLTEGLCGSRELQETQFKDALKCVRNYIPKTTFIAAKGNHDITGPGAREAFDNVMLPWLSDECGKQIDSASFYFMEGPDLFVFFDAYHNNDLDWLEKTLSRNRHRYAFVVMHPPAVPYNARSTWHLFSRAREKDVRERFLNILGANKVVLLTGHLHKYVVLARRTSTGTFVQFSMNSVISSPKILVRNHLEGVENYGSPLVELEPEFQPDTKEQRQKMLEDEKPYIAYFEYANFPGYAIINVSETGINIDIYTGDSDKVWKNVPLDSVLNN